MIGHEGHKGHLLSLIHVNGEFRMSAHIRHFGEGLSQRFFASCTGKPAGIALMVVAAASALF
jgi:hypothetical protein